MDKEQKYCYVCGEKLTEKQCKDEGVVKYCGHCEEFRFPLYSSAVSMVIFNPKKDKILLIQQYGMKSNILVAGYINKGETPQQALQREIKEEVGLNAVEWNYNDSMYFDKTETLMHNFVVVVDSENLKIKENEVDTAQWFTVKEAVEYIRPNSMAKKFLLKSLKGRNVI
ncbi:MAG: NUDIX domain-containing protein [Clostridia bacterium]|nr:NUDIX domain-containing protein [Clostridia bacterium]